MEKSSNVKNFIDSLIPLGMIFGSAIGTILGMFFKPSFLIFTVSGAGIGYLIGIIVYAVYSEKTKACL